MHQYNVNKRQNDLQRYFGFLNVTFPLNYLFPFKNVELVEEDNQRRNNEFEKQLELINKGRR